MFLRTSFTHLAGSEPLLTEECSCLATLLHYRRLSAAVGSQPATLLLQGGIQAWALLFRKGWGLELQEGFIPVYGGEERK